MFHINAGQKELFAQVAGADLNERLAAHLREHFPVASAHLDEPQMTAVVRYGVRRAQLHGFVTQRDICKYLNLMFVWGRDFDTDPELTWAAKLLALGCRPSRKMERLYAAAIERADEARGLFARACPQP